MFYRVLIKPTLQFLICFSYVSTNYLPGPCPVVPASTFVGFLRRSYLSYPEIIARVPFRDRTSWLFSNQNMENVKYYVKLCIEADTQKYGHQLFEIFFHNPEFGDESWTYFNSEPTNGSNSLIAERQGKYLYPLPRLTLTMDDVRIWIDDIFIIIWSCIAINDITRDEAVIFLRHNNVPPNIIEFEDFIGLLKRFSEEYLSKGLMNEIAWPTKMKDNTPAIYFPFKCQFEYKLLFLFGVVWVSVLVILVVALMFVIIKRKGNIVRPVGLYIR